MPNILDGNGLTTSTADELNAYYVAMFQQIYGSNVSVGPSTPDGQLIGIEVQANLDIEGLVSQVYTSFDPDQAIGVQQDQRYSINGIQRQGGTYSVTPVSVTVNAAVTLYGVDQTTYPAYTIQDNSGNQWQLITTQEIGGAGTYSYNFQAADPGAITTIPNTITVQSTVVLTVTAVNNPTPQASNQVGLNEESDIAFKIRRQRSTQGPSQGFTAGLETVLGNIPGVNFSRVADNKTSTVDIYGTPGHCLWAIVGGTGAAATIATAIYNNRSDGCNMRGAQTYTIAQLDGTNFVVQWDNVATQNLFIKFTATSIDGINAPKISLILQQLPTIFVPGIGVTVNISDLAGLVQQIDSNTLVTNAGFSTTVNGTYTPTLTTTGLNYQFVVDTANIIITPIIILPQTPSVTTGLSQQLSAFGGSQVYSWAITTNNSGGSINTSTGLYVGGAAIAIDTVTVTDTATPPNTASVQVTVV